MKIQKLKKYLLLLSIGLFLISLTQKVFCTANGDCGSYGQGLMCLLVGWIDLFAGGAGVSWLANPLLFLSWIFFFYKIKTTFILSLLSILFSLSFLLYDEIMVNEGGQMEAITGYQLGYWLWLLSSLVILAGSTYTLLSKR